MSELTYLKKPRLNRPFLIMAFGGWSNAGDVATGAHDYMTGRLKTKPLARIEPGAFFDLTRERPTVCITGGVIEELKMPSLGFTYHRGGENQPDLIFFKGPEPNFHWPRLCDLVFQLAADYKVQAVFTLGGSYDYVPHWLPAEISTIYSNRKAAQLLKSSDDFIMPSNYRGEACIHTLLLSRGDETGLPVIGLWGHSPMYIQTGNLKLHKALVEIIKRTTGLVLDTGDLNEGMEEMERRIDALAAQNPKLAEYIEDLKRDYDGPFEVCETKPGKRKGCSKPLGFNGRAKVIPLGPARRRRDD